MIGFILSAACMGISIGLLFNDLKDKLSNTDSGGADNSGNCPKQCVLIKRLLFGLNIGWLAGEIIWVLLAYNGS